MERYKNIIDDWEAFEAACNGHPVSTVRRNRIKAGPDFEQKLREDFPEAEKADWNTDVYRLHGTENPGKSSLHWRGEYYVQEESAILPVTVLEPEKGDRVLDMAAAPGGKTTQIASTIENDGVVIANDVKSKRLQSLQPNVYRQGAACAVTVNYDGRHLPEDEKYDRVLVDAPCSGEGDKAYRNFKPATRSEIKGLSTLQKQLAEKAAKLVNPGGTVVYSTCTITPVENEAVVEHIVENTDLEIMPIETELEHVEGVIEFEDEKYPEYVRKTVRIYPHHNDSGVIYVAKFRKPE